MNVIQVTYQFSRDEQTGFFRRNRASTDAIGLLSQWQAELPTREYDILRDDGTNGADEDLLVATLRTTQADVDNNQGNIDSLCHRFGLNRQVI